MSDAERLIEKLRAMHEEMVLATLELDDTDWPDFIPCTRTAHDPRLP